MHPCLFVTLWCLSCEPTGRTLPNSIGTWEVHLWQPLLGPEETWNMAHTLGRTSIWWASAVISLWVCGTVINRIVEYNRCYQCIFDWFFPSYLLSCIQFPFSPWVPASTEFNADHSKQFTCLEFFVSFMYKTVLDGYQSPLLFSQPRLGNRKDWGIVPKKQTRVKKWSLSETTLCFRGKTGVWRGGGWRGE